MTADAKAEVLGYILSTQVTVDGRHKFLYRGDPIPSGLAKADRDRLERRGLIVARDELAAWEKERKRSPRPKG